MDNDGRTNIFIEYGELFNELQKIEQMGLTLVRDDDFAQSIGDTSGGGHWYAVVPLEKGQQKE